MYGCFHHLVEYHRDRIPITIIEIAASQEPKRITAPAVESSVGIRFDLSQEDFGTKQFGFELTETADGIR